MELVPVASFPYREWAKEVDEQFLRAGLTPRIEERGPRAYALSVPRDQSPYAEEIMGVLGYLTCSVG